MESRATDSFKYFVQQSFIVPMLLKNKTIKVVDRELKTEQLKIIVSYYKSFVSCIFKKKMKR